MDEWNEACQVDAEISPAEWAILTDEARAWDIEQEIAREEAVRAAFYITYREAAMRTGLSVGTIRERVKRDEVEVIGTGGTHRIRWGDLLEALRVRPRHHRESVAGAKPSAARRRQRVAGRCAQVARESLAQRRNRA
jgi:excisionase family DNA binding protein